jgi:hypothetical protein
MARISGRRAPPFWNRDVTASREKESAFFVVLTIEKEPPWAVVPADFNLMTGLPIRQVSCKQSSRNKAQKAHSVPGFIPII